MATVWEVSIAGASRRQLLTTTSARVALKAATKAARRYKGAVIRVNPEHSPSGPGAYCELGIRRRGVLKNIQNPRQVVTCDLDAKFKAAVKAPQGLGRARRAPKKRKGR